MSFFSAGWIVRILAIPLGVVGYLAVQCLFAAPALASQGVESPPAIAFAGRVIGDSSRSRLILDFDRAVSYKTYALENPRRIVIDLSRTVFALNDKAAVVPESLVESWRHGRISNEKSRLVLNLAKPAKVENTMLRERGGEGRRRLIVDLVSVGSEEFSQTAGRAALSDIQKEKPAVPAKRKKGRKFVVVIDPGHGGIDGGAIGPHRVREKTVTLNFAQNLSQRLSKNSDFDVVMTRTGDDFVSLTERLEIAHEAKADLLISVHADSLRQNYIRGATVYTLSREGSDSISRMLARDQNRADLIAGLALPAVEDEVGDILIDLTRRETKAFSNRLADLLITEMKGQVKMIRNPHRSADFFVLKAPEIPSVLIELGYLSNDEDERLLNSRQWQVMVAEKVAQAVRAFFEPRMAGSK